MSFHKEFFKLKYGKPEQHHEIVNKLLNHVESSHYELRKIGSHIHNAISVDPKIFETLVTHPRARNNYNIRDAVSVHPETPKHVIDRMVNDARYDEQWHSIAMRDDVTPEHLTKIATEGIDAAVNERAGRAALEHPKAPKALLDKYSHHSDPYVAAAVAYNPNSTEEHLNRIAENHRYTAGGDSVATVRRRRGLV